MGIVLGLFGAFQGNIWSVAPFIPVGNLQKNTKKIISHSDPDEIFKVLHILNRLVETLSER